MGSIRQLQRQDAPVLAELHARAFSDSTRPPGSYFESVYLDSPGADDALPSLVHVEADGTISGFIGVCSRPFVFKKKEYSAAVISNLMVDPSHRSGMAGLRLLRQVLAGPQDYSISDLINQTACKLWLALGGQTVRSFNMGWRWQLRRPSWLGLYPVLRSVVRATRALRAGSLGREADLTPSSDQPPVPLVLTTRDLEPRQLEELLETTAERDVLRPVYDDRLSAWLLERARNKRRFGVLQIVAAQEPNGNPAGWFIYLLRNKMPSKVLQVGARMAALGSVLDSLAGHARQRGSRSLAGRLEPRLMNALAGRRTVTSVISEYAMVVHSRNDELLHAFHRGDVFFSELEGEWITAYHGESAT